MTKAMNKRGIIISAGVLFAALVTGCILWIYYMAPSSYLALDVNPSIEIHTNRLNQVTSIEPINEDAKQIMAGYELTDRNLETVIHNIVDRIILGGFLAPDKDNAILVSTDDSSSSSQITDTVNSIITNYLAEKQLNATVIPQNITVTSQSIEEAHDNYVSIGKMALIQELIANDNTLTVEQLSTLRISDLVALAESKNISLAGLFYSASTASNTNEIQEDANTNSNDALIDTQEDNDLKENAIENGDNEDQDDNDLEDRDDGDNEDQNDNEDQDESKIEDREDNDNHEKSKIEDREDNDNDDQEDSKIEDREDGDYEDQEDSKIEDREDGDNEDQEDSKIEDREDGDNEDQEDSYFEDREGDDNEDQQDSYHVEQKSNDREDQNEGDNED